MSVDNNNEARLRLSNAPAFSKFAAVSTIVPGLAFLVEFGSVILAAGSDG